AGGGTPPAELTDMSKEPTLRLFLDDLYGNPNKYKNALVMNLHGELLPMPALRNYSDAAKSPVVWPGLRVVTHPEELRTRRADAGFTDPLRFRMYAYGHRTSAAAYAGPAVMTDPMVVEVVGMNLTDGAFPTKLAAACTLQNLKGGVSVGGTSNYAAAWANAKHSTDSPVANEMYYIAQYVAPAGGQPACTRVYLFNTPTACTPDASGRGLPNSERARLYQLEYVPCPVANTTTAPIVPSFTARDLTSTSTTLPKNTARWTLSLAPSVLTSNCFVTDAGSSYNPTGDVVVKVRTRVATGYSSGGTTWQQSGTVFPVASDPDNLSVTYAWWADSKEDVPITERSQFNGDPRHVPYKDCFIAGDDFPESFNWYHDNLNNNTEAAYADYTTIVATLATSKLRNLWSSGQMACDVPRYMQLLREGLVKSRCVFTTLTGWSFYYLGIGADIGYDSANGYPTSIPSNLAPYGTTGNGTIDNLIAANGQTFRRFVRQGGTGYWWGMPWLGELAPDSVAASMWESTAGGTIRGNLTPGTASSQYYLAACSATHNGSNRTAYGTTIADHRQRCSGYGCTTFFNIGSSASTFQHSSSTANGTLTTVGNELANNYNLTVPSSAPVSRPFSLTANVGTAVGEHWGYAPYLTRFTASTLKTYYSHSAGAGSSLIKLVDPTNTNAGYMVMNGISNAVDNGTTFIAKYSLLTLIHSFFEAGSTTNTLRVDLPPRLEITSPTAITELDNPAAITIQFATAWTRWDNLPYTGTGTFSGAESQLQYVIQYSRDAGQTWLYVQDDSPATPGVRPTSSFYLVNDATTGAEEFDWSVPADDFPEGTYQLRIDCYRSGASVHYSYHQTRLFIQR
ncbi:MAG: hypothetical protein WAT39_23385, partial [Planctomycetota bacterium]